MITTPLIEIDPKQIRVEFVENSGTVAKLQAEMSKAIWRPGFGRRLGFRVWHGDALLGIIFLCSPMMLTARNQRLGLDKLTNSERGKELRNYMDMSVCVAAQPTGWHWNIGKLLAMLAYTLGDYVNAKYPNDTFKGVTTTSLYGGDKPTQYTGIYEYLGETAGYGHEHVNDESYTKMLLFLREHCDHCTPNCSEPFEKRACGCRDCEAGTASHPACVVPAARFGSGANARMRRIAAYRQHSGDKSVTLTHGHKRGIYYHDAVDPSKRQEVIDKWYKKWGYPRYLKTKDKRPPYMDGKTGGKQYE